MIRSLLALIILPCCLLAKTVEMVPNSRVYLDTFDGDFDDYNKCPNEWFRLKCLLAEIGWPIKCVWNEDMGSSDIIIANNYFPFLANLRSRFPNKKKILIVWEPPTVDPELHNREYFNQFDKVLTWNDSLVDGKKFIKMHYPSFGYPGKNLPPFEDRHLACMFIGNKQSKHPRELYSYRRRIIDYYEKRKDLQFHLYGRGWENENLSCFIGAVEDKYTPLSLYKFAYCFENYDNNDGYITEKIFDCFRTLTIPIYLGAANIHKYIPEGCYIDARKFNSIEEMDRYIKDLDEAAYQKYVDNIMAYCNSSAKNRFTQENFMLALTRAVVED